jgi:hypothetical protein
MRDKATMLRETGEGCADLRTMFEGMTEEQVSRVWLGIVGARDIVARIHCPATLPESGDQSSRAAIQRARSFWAPGSFWGRYPTDRTGTWSGQAVEENAA